MGCDPLNVTGMTLCPRRALLGLLTIKDLPLQLFTDFLEDFVDRMAVVLAEETVFLFKKELIHARLKAAMIYKKSSEDVVRDQFLLVCMSFAYFSLRYLKRETCVMLS